MLKTPITTYDPKDCPRPLPIELLWWTYSWVKTVYNVCGLLTSRSKRPHRGASLNPSRSFFREREYFFLFCSKFLTIAFLECALTGGLRVVNTITERILRSRRAFGVVQWNYLKVISPTAGPCTLHFSLEIPSA